MNRRNFLAALPSGAALYGQTGRSGSAAPASFELDEVTIDELGRGMQSGKYTARRITELYLSRIEATNRRGPTLGAVIETNPEALAIADALDVERKQGE